jgi:hypothetical protein
MCAGVQKRMLWTAVWLVVAAAAGAARPAATQPGRVLQPAVAPDGVRPLPPLPPLAQELPWTSAALLPQLSRSHLPPATAGGETRPGAAARQQPMRLRPTADRPEVAWQAEFFPRAPWLVPSAPPVYAASPDAARTAAAWREVGPDAARPEPNTDPTWDQVQARTLATPAELRQKPAPFVRLAIPDPFENIAALRLSNPPVDAEGPTACFDLPSRPPLPGSPAKPAGPQK